MNPENSTLQDIRQRIMLAAHAAGRAPDSIALIAVGKTFSAVDIRALAKQGQRDFAENYVQEAVNKQAELVDLDLVWHFIGPVQRNKTHIIATRFAWVHSVDRLLIAERLSIARAAMSVPLNVCIQVNISREASKSGVLPEDLPALARAVAVLPHLRLRGLMAIPRPEQDPTVQRKAFAALRDCLLQLNHDGLALDVLSMGMSSDFEAAIAEGATMVRLGSALFGTRYYSMEKK